jgi:cysteinyl-tRNA synthetase
LITIYDTVSKKKRPFEPISEGCASIYVCGPTVYDDAHLGHARSSLAFDLLVRTLKAHGYEVTLAKNFTDIDDKILTKVAQTGKSMAQITSFYINRYLEEMDQLGVMRADIEPKATESIEAIEAMIQTLLDRDIAYEIEGGDIYFDTSKDASYGSLSSRLAEEEVAQSRVTHSDAKRNAKDFALWKASKDTSEIGFETHFSRGRPGWHIECSAMIEKHFKSSGEYSIDIHGGGADLLFPHHENEAAQSRCATGHALSKYWMHNGFVQIDGEKMSKSLGNSFFLKDALALYDGEVLRYYLNSVHYRNDFNFSEEELLLSKKRLDRLYRLKKRVFGGKGSSVNSLFKRHILEAMGDDLNISIALAHIDEMVSNTNDALDANPKDKALKKETLANIDFIQTLLGFGGKEPFFYFQMGVDKELKATIEALISQRAEAKRVRDFEKSDAIRQELQSLGVAIMDTPSGTVWESI